MKLQLATWPEVQAYLEKSQGIVIPIGSTEQHGPTGLIGTDAICPETIANGLSERGILVGPTLSIGMAQHHMAFPGTITLQPTTLMAVIHDVVTSLKRHGFQQFMFLNGHGGNIHTTETAFAQLWAEHSLQNTNSGLAMRLVNWFQGRRVRELIDALYGQADGWHATPSEIALTWHAYPDQMRDVPLDPDQAPFGEIRDALDYRRRFPDGRIGSRPQMATLEHGRQFYEAGVEDALEAWASLMQSDGVSIGS
jgi:creatinine amidohydrolase